MMTRLAAGGSVLLSLCMLGGAAAVSAGRMPAPGQASRAQAADVLNQKLPQRFSALAVDFEPGRMPVTQVEIEIRRWSTGAEADTLVTTLQEKGNEALLKVLAKQPKVGTIRPIDSLGWDLRYARQEPGQDGGRTIFIVTDRWIGFLERANLSRSLDYPFTTIQLRLGADGKGSGTMSLATRLRAIRNMLFIDSYEMQDIQLRNLTQER